MAYCTKCGTQVADGVKFCTSCGTPMGAAQQPQPQPQTAPQQPQPQPQQTYTQQQAQQAYAQQPYTQPQPQYAPVYTEEPISTGAYIGIFFLLMLPVINIILLIVWACGGCNKKNKTNLSRALLVWMLIGALIGGIIALAGGLLFGDSINELMELGKEMGNV